MPDSTKRVWTSEELQVCDSLLHVLDIPEKQRDVFRPGIMQILVQYRERTRTACILQFKAMLNDMTV